MRRKYQAAEGGYGLVFPAKPVVFGGRDDRWLGTGVRDERLDFEFE